MDKNYLISLVQKIVVESCELKNRFTDELDAPVNYACIFSQDQVEYTVLIKLAHELGVVIQNTLSGPLLTNKNRLRKLKAS